MPERRTKRGSERTPLEGDFDVLICGASFAGLAVARELAGAVRPDGSPARVMMLDRYEVGERQTSACGIPTAWLEAMDLMGSHRQTFGELVVSTPHGTSRWPLPWTFSTFDYRELCALLRAQGDCTFETAKVNGRTGNTVHTDRGDLSAPLVVDALGWRRMLAGDGGFQPPDAPLSRGLEVHPGGSSPDLAIWIDRSIVPAGYGWSFPAGEELRIGVGSFDPRFHVKDNTVKLAEDLGSDAVRFQGNWIPHQLRPAHRGRDLLLRRLRRALPPAHRRGHPHRLLLRHRLRPRAAVRGGGTVHARGRPLPLRRIQRLARVEVPLAPAHSEGGAAGVAAAPERSGVLHASPRDRGLGLRPLPARGPARLRDRRPAPAAARARRPRRLNGPVRAEGGAELDR